MTLATLTVFIRAAAADTIDAFSVQSGDLLAGTTWDAGLAPVGTPPVPNYIHNIVSGHKVTADGSQRYTGAGVNVSDGTLDYTASAVHLPSVTVAAGATVTETTTGEFYLGDIFLAELGGMELNGNLIITAEHGADAALDMVMSGTGTATVNVEAGGTLFITDVSGFGGVLQFNGGGDKLLYEGPDGSTARIEMNSTGGNRLDLNIDGFGGGAGNVVFSQPGIIHHQTLDENPRLQNLRRLTADASVTVDVTTGYAGNERRMLFSNGLGGSETIAVNGTPLDPTSTAGDISRNEFELGWTGEPTGESHVPTLSYAGTVIANDYINVECRRHMPGGVVVVNQNALLDIGYDEAENFPSLRTGEITVNSNGTLEVGYEQLDGGVVRHNPFNLHLTTQRGRSGDLTLATGSTTTMQISDLTDLPSGMKPFDTISAEGDVSLGGTLELLINPALTAFYSDTNGDPTFAYVPTDGDAFEIVSVVAETLPTDLDGNGSVGSEDIALWEELQGNSLAAGDYDVTADVDGNGITDILDLTAIQNDLGTSGTLSGSIAGDFDSMSIVDPMGVLTGFTVAKTVTATAVTLTINAMPPHHVSPEGSHVAPYATWATAATNIQAALDVALDGVTVLVTNGVYDTGGVVVHGSLTNRIAVTNAVTVRSVNGPDDTLIVGSGPLGDSAVRCAYLTDGAALVGFTLTNGHTRTTGDDIWDRGGGGVLMEGGSVSNCMIAGNSAETGGGALCLGDSLAQSCTIIGNHAIGANYDVNSYIPGGTARGGGIYCSGNSILEGCIITANRANGGNGSLDGGTSWGGGAYCASNSMVRGSFVNGNRARGGDGYDPDIDTGYGGIGCGGGLYCRDDSTAQGCLISANRANGGTGYGGYVGVGGDGRGGGLYCTGISVVQSCTLSGNQANPGGGWGLFDGYPGAGIGGGTYCRDGGALTNCVVWGNSATDSGDNWETNGTDVAFSYCCTSPNPGGLGNINDSPHFVDEAGGDYRLLASCPCRDAGTNEIWMAGSTDLDGNPRIHYGTVDIGAYEFPSYRDIGLRFFDGSNRVGIACEPDDWPLRSPLRIAKGTNTYGVLLVDPDDVAASVLVIQTGSGPKAPVGFFLPE